MFCSSSYLNTMIKLKKTMKFSYLSSYVSIEQTNIKNKINSINSNTVTNNRNNLIKITNLTHPFSGEPSTIPVSSINDIINNFFPDNIF